METIKSKREFERVFTLGRRYNHPLVRSIVLRVTDEPGKVAFVAPKRLGSAVFRNRCKRVLREAARSCGLPSDGVQIILFATKSTHSCSQADLREALMGLLTRARVA